MKDVIENLKKTLGSHFLRDTLEDHKDIEIYYIEEEQKDFKLKDFVLVFFSNSFLKELKHERYTKATKGCVLIYREKDKTSFSFYPDLESSGTYRWKKLFVSQDTYVFRLIEMIFKKQNDVFCKNTEEGEFFCTDTLLIFSENFGKMIESIKRKYKPIFVI
jgi:hypothetical protein